MASPPLPLPFDIPRLRVLTIGSGQVTRVGSGVRLSLGLIRDMKYGDAQIDDYAGLPRSRFAWRPPVRLRVRARASQAAPPGTLGFGLWNDPLAFSGGLATRQGLQLPAAPECAWFFYGSPPNDFSLFTGNASPGWRAMVLRPSRSVLSWVTGPAATGLLPVARRAGLGGRALSAARRWVQAEERLLGDASIWHDYCLEWQTSGLTFNVDGAPVLESTLSPAGPLGFVAWVDNQFAVVSESGRFGFGVLPVSEPHWLELAEVRVDLTGLGDV